MRARQAEDVMQGEKIEPALVDIVYETILDELISRTSPYRSAADYRSHMAKVLLQEVLEIAWRRAGKV
jgi:CO/xanthine dehydrogenase FAD-binding subunit